MVVFMFLYVDDILLIGNDVRLLSLVKIWFSTQFQMKDLEEAQYILWIKVLRDHKNRKLMLSQDAYIDKLLVKYVMQDSKKCLLPFRHGIPLSQDQCPQTFVERDHIKVIFYASIMDSLKYVMLCTRPDIFFFFFLWE